MEVVTDAVPSPEQEQASAEPQPQPRPHNRSSSTRQEYTRTQKKKLSSIKQVQYIYNSCTDVTVGNKTDIFTGKDGTQMKEAEPRVLKVLRKLRNLRKPVTVRDIVIASESVDMDGLEILAKELGIGQVELNQIKPSEHWNCGVTYRIVVKTNQPCSTFYVNKCTRFITMVGKKP